MSIFYESPFGDANDRAIEGYEVERDAAGSYFDPRDSGLSDFHRLMDMARQDERDAAGAIIRDLLGYIEELEANLDAADENLASEGGCGTKEWKEGAAEYLPRDKRLSYVRDDYVAALDEARAYLGDAA